MHSGLSPAGTSATDDALTDLYNDTLRHTCDSTYAMVNCGLSAEECEKKTGYFRKAGCWDKLKL